MRSRAIDKSNNTELFRATTFWVDVSSPSVKNVVPAEGTSKLSSLLTISGSASDSPSTGKVHTINIRIKQESPLAYWNGTVFDIDLTEPDEAWFTPTLSSDATYWYYPFDSSKWSDGTAYKLESKSIDKTGKYSLTYSTANFTIDYSTPTTYATTPSNGSYLKTFSSIDGYATSNDISKTYVSIKNMYTNLYWDGANDFNSGPVIWRPITPTNHTSTATWSYTSLTQGKLTSGVSYYVMCFSSDTSNPSLIETPSGARSTLFVYDSTEPITAILTPNANYHNSSLSTISGTAEDYPAFSGARISTPLASIEMYILMHASNSSTTEKYFNESDFVENGGEIYWVNISTLNQPAWDYFDNDLYWTQNSSYTIKTKDTDRAGNVQGTQFAYTSKMFWYDNVKPTSTVTMPPTGNHSYNTFTTISGTCVDSVAGSVTLSTVTILIQDVTLNSTYYNINSQTWVSGSEYWNYVSTNAAGTIWQKILPDDSAWTNAHQYRIKSKAKDLATNEEVPSSGNTFVYDITKPTSVITMPANNMGYMTVPTLSGTAYDAFGLTNLKISIKQNEPNGYYYDTVTSSFTEAVETWFDAKTSGNWTTWYSTRTSANSWNDILESGKWYIIRSSANDIAGNWQTTASSNVFTFDNIPPVTVIESPVQSSTMSALSTISGTSTRSEGKPGTCSFPLPTPCSPAT